MTDTAPAGPLTGLLAIDLTRALAGPHAAMMLGDLGARVIKVESPGSGDDTRSWGPPFVQPAEGDRESTYYLSANRNKESITLDLKDPSDKAVLTELLRRADILLENFRPGTLEKWGLGPEVLDDVNPKLVITRISAFGQTGPMSQRPGFAAVAEAFGGLRELVGDPDRPPVRTGVSIGDSIAGIYAAFGTVMALFQREHTAVPLEQRIIDVALNESILAVMESLVPDYLAYGVKRERVGGRMEGIAPSNAYPCADGNSIIVAGNGDAIYQRYMTTIGRPDLAVDPGLQTNAGRWLRREELDAAIGQWTSQFDRDEALELLGEAGVPSGPIYTAADICDDAQYEARNMIQHFDVDTGETEPKSVGFPGIVPVIGGTSIPIRTVGPDLGQHTREVLAELLDLTDEQIGTLT